MGLLPDRIRFHLDENVDARVARALQQHGVDVTTAVTAHLRTATDEAHRRYAAKERRVIVTHDDDFLRLAGEDISHAGIVYCHKTKYAVGDLIRQLILVYEVLTPDEMHNQIEFV